MHPKHKGALNELKAHAWLLEQGFEVFANVSPHGDTDLIARTPDGELIEVDVTTGRLRPDGRVVTAKPAEPAQVRVLAAVDGECCYWAERNKKRLPKEQQKSWPDRRKVKTGNAIGKRA